MPRRGIPIAYFCSEDIHNSGGAIAATAAIVAGGNN
jgi:hypothetical protein